MGKPIMFLGTASNVGKSLLVAAFCRIFYQDGYEVAPFKSQNMALNSYITADGLEMGRAQVFQAEAAGKKPSVQMNPILLKPYGEKNSQVIVEGKVHENMGAVAYHQYKPQLAKRVGEIYKDLASQNDIVVLEGAGSPAEINLREHDLVNMGMAEIADAPVVLIGDIDKGGVFASLLGTYMLLTEEEKQRVKGILINKFRGDIRLLEPGIKMLEELIPVPVLGVIPYVEVQIEEEDSVTTRFDQRVSSRDLEVAVIRLPHLSNYTDFHVFETQEDVALRYIKRGERIGNPDLLILPGSKNTISDLLYLKETGLAEQIVDFAAKGGMIIGICGGYQMLGEKLLDPQGIEGEKREVTGLGLLPITTLFSAEKVTKQVQGTIQGELGGIWHSLGGKTVAGYEMHMGRSERTGETVGDLIHLDAQEDMPSHLEGCVQLDGRVAGTYMHGLFDALDFTRELLNQLRLMKGLETVTTNVHSLQEFKEGEYNKLATAVRTHVDMQEIYRIVGV